MKNDHKPTPKWVVLNTLMQEPEWHVFENIYELNGFIVQKSIEDWDYLNTYKIFEIDIKNTFKASVDVNLNIIQ
jgi:hypothetical protein